MADLSVADIIQQYDKTVILYKGIPHKVKQVAKTIKLLDLVKQKEKLVEFSLKDFNSPVLRLGYVNMDETSIYVSRKPVRMMKIGIDYHNCDFLANANSPCPNSISDVIGKMKYMESIEFGKMMLGHYPSLKDAFERAASFEGSVAFDKQFAVDAYANIYFKGNQVGKATESLKEKDITFYPEHQFLSLMIGNSYEHDARAFGKKAA